MNGQPADDVVGSLDCVFPDRVTSPPVPVSLLTTYFQLPDSLSRHALDKYPCPFSALVPTDLISAPKQLRVIFRTISTPTAFYFPLLFADQLQKYLWLPALSTGVGFSHQQQSPPQTPPVLALRFLAETSTAPTKSPPNLRATHVTFDDRYRGSFHIACTNASLVSKQYDMMR